MEAGERATRGGESIQKSFFPFGAGQPASLFFAKPAVAVSCYPVIYPISYRAGDDPKNIQDRPGEAELFHDAKGAGAAGVCFVVVE